MNELKTECDNITKMMMFEINYKDYGMRADDEYEVYNINCTNEGLNCTGVNGFISIEWDNIFSLDEHLQELFDLCLQDMGV